MPDNYVAASFTFHPVGQGLFGTGRLDDARMLHRRRHAYTWVYDCGTNSAKRHLEESIERYARSSFADGGPPTLDLVVVSHFDHDHISGLVSLLSKFHVRDLLLPYVPLWQRLEIAFLEGRAYRSALTRFLINPVAFVAQLPGANVERILFAPGGGEAPELPQYDEGSGPDLDRPDENPDGPLRGENRWPVHVAETNGAPDGDETACIEAARDALERRGIRIEYMRPGQAITVARIWEFVPYNDSDLAHLATAKFKSQVALLRDKLLSAPNSVDRQDALDQLKDRFDITFGRSGLRRNLVSLFLYAGPTIRANLHHSSHEVMHDNAWQRDYSARWSNFKRFGAVLYTGDGFLNTDQRLNKLWTYIGARRFERIDALQVMHHGSRHNWFAGIAKKLAPTVSVFSSDPLRKRSHPHAEVVKDFLGYGPVQVDARHQLTIRCAIAWKS